ncbi:hypothetical protein SNK05_010698 [Fusarium graminearum]
MNAGDLAFFYASNCKEPGIVGVMEIVKEFSEDRTSQHHSFHTSLTLFCRLRSQTQRSILRSQVDQRETHLGPGARRVSKEVCRTNWSQGVERAGKGWWSVGDDAVVEAVEA